MIAINRPDIRTLDDLRPFVEPIAIALGHMPSADDLEQSGRHDLCVVVTRLGGYKRVAAHLGLLIKRQPRSLDSIRAAIQPLSDHLGRMPSKPELRRAGLSSEARALQSFGGVGAVAEKIGLAYDKPARYGDAESLRPYIQPLADTLGRMPSQPEMDAAGLGRMACHIAKMGGMAKVAAVLGLSYRLPARYRDVSELRPVLDPMVAILGRMPSQREAKKDGDKGLSAAIYRMGGYGVVADALGYPYSGRRYWRSVEDLRPHIEGVMRRPGQMPRDGDLGRDGRYDIVNAIVKFGGPEAVAIKLGYRYAGRKAWTTERLREELQKYVDEIGEMPSSGRLLADGRRDMTIAIHSFGGMPVVAERFGFPYVPQYVRQSMRIAARTASGEIYRTSKPEKMAQEILAPLGFFRHAVRVKAHHFDFGDRAGRVVEVNGCYYHDHRSLKPTCRVSPIKDQRGQSPLWRDERTRRLAADAGLDLLEIWECEMASWGDQIDRWLSSAATKEERS